MKEKIFKTVFRINLILCGLVIFGWILYFIDYYKRNTPFEETFYPYNDIYYSNEYIECIEEFKIPDFLYDYIVENEWKIMFCTRDIEPLFNEKSSILDDGLAVTVFDEKTIFVEYKGNLEEAKRSFYHELGHVFDYALGMESLRKDFAYLYDSFKDTYKYPFKTYGFLENTYINEEQSEFFAGLFEAYYYYPEYLIGNYPGLYDYYNDLQNTF